MLYVGNCVPTRALPIVFEALRESRLTDYEFSIVGDGPAVPAWKKLALGMGPQTKVKFVGRIPRSQLNSWYASADVLVFPALRDSGGSALLEAMARFVPVICLDWAGPGEQSGEGRHRDGQDRGPGDPRGAQVRPRTERCPVHDEQVREYESA